MAHSNNNQTDLNQHPDSNNRQSSDGLSRDIEALNSGLRIDFDQKLGELADLLARFKAMVTAPAKDAENDSDFDAPVVNGPVVASREVTGLEMTGEVSEETADAVDSNPTANNRGSVNTFGTTVASQETADDTSEVVPTQIVSTPSLYAPEPARFETGLYKLNCQLYRFRLELDQEMEFREERLHIHFRNESELSVVLQNISDRSSEINPDS